MILNYDIIVIGSGPAGIAATVTAAQHGCSVCLLDEQPTPGGQIYRALAKIKQGEQPLKPLQSRDYLRGKPLIRQLTDYQTGSNVTTHYSATVWQLDTNGTVTYSQGKQASTISGSHIIIASGAIERPFPLAGWTLPGTFTVGAAQILMKSNVIVSDQAILVGSGPLLYTFACQLIRAGYKPAALIDISSIAARRANLLRASRLLPSILGNSQNLLTGLSLLWRIRRAGVKCYSAASNIEITGDHCVQAVRFSTGSSEGKTHNSSTVELKCDAVFLHDGIVPNTQISQSLRLQHRWNNEHQYFEPVTNQFGVSSQSNISIAGDGSGIIGAVASEQHGRLVALNALQSLGVDIGTNEKQLATHMKTVNRARKFQRFLAALYPPSTIGKSLPGNTILCRCENVTADDIRRYIGLGCTGPNQTKVYGRCGMGPCQGRFCSLTITRFMAEESGVAPAKVGSFRVRSPIKPVTLAELASLTAKFPDGEKYTK